MANNDSGHRVWRSAAGNVELFVGVYFVTFGVLAAMFFGRSHPNRSMACIGVALAGGLLVFRARRLLDWNRWVFWTVVYVLIVAPIAWFAPAMLTAQ